MAETDWKQINLKLTEELLERINAASKKASTDRSSWIRSSLIAILDGQVPLAAPVTPSSSGVDQEARDAMTKLAAKVNLIQAALEKKEARLAALEADKAQAPAPFELDI